MLKGFKEFIMRGNLIELAVAFVMGTAFATVVTATVNLLMSLIAKASGGQQPNFNDYQPWKLPVGAWLTALLTFLVLAAVVYFLVMVPYIKLQERRARGQEPTPPSEEVTVLTQIRDLLSEGRTTNQP